MKLLELWKVAEVRNGITSLSAPKGIFMLLSCRADSSGMFKCSALCCRDFEINGSAKQPSFLGLLQKEEFDGMAFISARNHPS